MGHEHWTEPKEGQRAGFGKFKKLPTPYDTFMESSRWSPGSASAAGAATFSSTERKASGVAMPLKYQPAAP
jgi:hypothetical protein